VEEDETKDIKSINDSGISVVTPKTHGHLSDTPEMLKNKVAEMNRKSSDEKPAFKEVNRWIP